MIDHDHDRLFVRPLTQAVQAHGGAFAEVLARRAENDPELARHLLIALDAVTLAFPEIADEERPRPRLPYRGAMPAVSAEAEA